MSDRDFQRSRSQKQTALSQLINVPLFTTQLSNCHILLVKLINACLVDLVTY